MQLLMVHTHSNLVLLFVLGSVRGKPEQKESMPRQLLILMGGGIVL
jgi:hypothetical protein